MAYAVAEDPQIGAVLPAAVVIPAIAFWMVASENKPQFAAVQPVVQIECAAVSYALLLLP